jgi:hypothetical protein
VFGSLTTVLNPNRRDQIIESIVEARVGGGNVLQAFSSSISSSERPPD